MSGIRKEHPADGGASEIRRGNSDGGADIIGFIDQESGQPNPLMGQGNMALVKDQPVIEQITKYWDSSQLTPTGLPYVTTVEEYAILPPINVENYSRLRLVIVYRPGVIGVQEPSGSLGILSLLHEGLQQTAPDIADPTIPELWVASGVVNPVLNVRPAPPYTAPVAIQNGYARRAFWSSELTWNWFEGLTAPFPYSPVAQAVDLWFDTQSLTAWRLRVGDRAADPETVDSASTLQLYYQLQR